MSYASLEQSKQGAQPVELYQFIRGSTTFRYTSAGVSLTRMSNTFTPAAITRSNVTLSGTVPKDTVEIKVPIYDDVVYTLTQGQAFARTTVTIFRTHANDTNVLAIWKGRVAKVGFTNQVATMTCEPVFSSLERNGIPVPYQRNCPHVFGGQGCFVNRESYKQSVTISSISGAWVNTSPVPTGTLLGGVFKAADGSSTTIIDQNTSGVKLMRQLASLATSQSATLYRGCDRSVGTCFLVFNNIGNFGGFPGIPRINPFTIQRSVFF